MTMTSVRPKEFIVNDDEPFKHDRLARQNRVEALCRLIKELQEPAMLAVNGPFGSGKSVFLRMCAMHLRSQELEVAEFDAWQQSHTQTPLVDLVAALTESITATEKLVVALREIAVKLACRVASTATGGIVKREDFQASEDISAFDKWKETESRRAEFRKELGKVVGESKKLIVLIDELDRCPPARALEILDVARHLFDIPGVVVVLGINEREMRHRVKTLYGQDCDAEKYLRRFVDLMIDLPGPVSNMAEFLNEAFAEAGLRNRLEAGPSQQYSGSMIELLAAQSEMSARDILQLTHRTARVLALTPALESLRSPDWALQHAVIAVCVLRWAAPEGYRQFVEGEIGIGAFGAVATLVEALSLDELLSDGNSIAVMIVAVLLKVGLGEFSGMAIHEFKEQFVDAKIGDATLSERVQHRFYQLDYEYWRADLKYICDLVEFAI